MDKLLLIIRREFIARVRNRTFIIMTFVSPLMIVGMFAVIGWLVNMNKDEVRTIAVHDTSQLFISEFKDSEHLRFRDFSATPVEIAKDSVVLQDFYGLLYIPISSATIDLKNEVRFYSDNAPSIEVLNTLEGVLNDKLTRSKLLERGLDVDEIENAKTKVSLKIEDFSGEKSSKMANIIKIAFGGATGYLLLMFIIIYGNMIMRSVIEEKTSRIIEIIISSVKPLQLMLGKILGTSLAGVTQFLIWLVIGGILLFIGVFVLGIDPSAASPAATAVSEQNLNMAELQPILNDIGKLPLVTLISCFFLYFIGGYFLYSSLYAAIGAAVDNETDTQQFMMPIVMLLVLGFYIGAFVVVENPHGTISVLFSMFPFTSPIVMLMRIPFGVAWWEIAISVCLLFLSIVGIAWLAAKIYRIGILMYGKKPSYKELLKWIRY